ncbi:thiopeptide-type bacteriocin biosynthesis protein [Streptomyces sp. NPDC014894]|uniref:thiopeptide-type bacteriocin biosynthesis protein n=1 Tax=Streptomyces sp. NPDC014894 TaxID=3364931 RepID=UPI0036F88366
MIDVLVGASVQDAAHKVGVEPTVLADAVEVFLQAGHQALAHQAGTPDWWQVYLQFADWAASETLFASRVLPILREAEAQGSVEGWWYTRKHPCWRLRLRTAPAARRRLGAALDQLTSDGYLTRWWQGVYEPETTAFGGSAGMDAAHTLFVADSRAIVRGQHRDVSVGRRELSVLLCTIMMRATGLEWYEQGDVWHRVFTDEHRSAISGVPQNHLAARAAEIRTLLTADGAALLRSGGPLEPIAEWATAFRHTGQSLADAVQRGTLDRGLRQILSLHVIFHWNRLGLSVGAQSVLAWAARAAILGLPQSAEQAEGTATAGESVPLNDRWKSR